MNNIITEVSPAVNLTFVQAPERIGANQWMCAGGEIVIGGPTAPGGNLYCQMCESTNCTHCQAVDMAWQAGQLTQAEIPFDGRPCSLQ